MFSMSACDSRPTQRRHAHPIDSQRRRQVADRALALILDPRIEAIRQLSAHLIAGQHLAGLARSARRLATLPAREPGSELIFSPA
jgi:hypothetical protein